MENGMNHMEATQDFLPRLERWFGQLMVEIHSGQPDRVIAMREDFQRVMAQRYEQKIEELTGRKVLAFLSQAHVEPDITMEIFFVDGHLPGFGAIEVTEPE